MGTYELLTNNILLQNLTFRGGGKRDRTADLLHAMQALSQLSYTPEKRRNIKDGRACCQRLSFIKSYQTISHPPWQA
jgi:hypothetical protein